MALGQWGAGGGSTAGVFFGQGPSSKVSPTSPSRRKSWLLKCSNPKPGPPVVSISTTRETSKALGLLHEVAAGIGHAPAAGVGGLPPALSPAPRLPPPPGGASAVPPAAAAT